SRRLRALRPRSAPGRQRGQAARLRPRGGIGGRAGGHARPSAGEGCGPDRQGLRGAPRPGRGAHGGGGEADPRPPLRRTTPEDLLRQAMAEAVKEVSILWISEGMSCDGDTRSEERRVGKEGRSRASREQDEE